jgi:GIY-YIG catalytic domain
MAINYNNSKIYKIVSPTTDKIYIGSTTQPLCKRIAEHLSNYRQSIVGNTKRYMTSYEILKLGDYSIKIIENCNFENKEQLRQREGYYIKLHRDIVVNKHIAGRTQKEWECDNKEHTAERKKQYGIDNKEQLRQYRIDNAEQLRQWRINNKENENELQRQRRQAKINRIWLNELTTL